MSVVAKPDIITAHQVPRIDRLGPEHNLAAVPEDRGPLFDCQRQCADENRGGYKTGNNRVEPQSQQFSRTGHDRTSCFANRFSIFMTPRKAIRASTSPPPNRNPALPTSDPSVSLTHVDRLAGKGKIGKPPHQAVLAAGDGQNCHADHQDERGKHHLERQSGIFERGLDQPEAGEQHDCSIGRRHPVPGECAAEDGGREGIRPQTPRLPLRPGRGRAQG